MVEHRTPILANVSVLQNILDHSVKVSYFVYNQSLGPENSHFSIIAIHTYYVMQFIGTLAASVFYTILLLLSQTLLRTQSHWVSLYWFGQVALWYSLYPPILPPPPPPPPHTHTSTHWHFHTHIAILRLLTAVKFAYASMLPSFRLLTLDCVIKNCMNGGRQDSTCDCACPSEYTGPLCESELVKC